MLGLRADFGDGYLMRAPKTLDFFTVDLLRSGPSLGASQNDHGPMGVGSRGCAGSARFILYGLDLFNHDIQGGCHLLMHGFRIRAFDEIRLITITPEQILQFLMADARKHCRARDLVSVEVQD